MTFRFVSNPNLRGQFSDYGVVYFQNDKTFETSERLAHHFKLGRIVVIKPAPRFPSGESPRFCPIVTDACCLTTRVRNLGSNSKWEHTTADILRLVSFGNFANTSNGTLYWSGLEKLQSPLHLPNTMVCTDVLQCEVLLRLVVRL